MATPAKRASRPGRLRIIGGQWRGRRLQFPAVEGLRPTPDRVRETLFNWLAPVVHGAHCADLFAGSGALGLEALSRGAASCDFVDTSGPAVRAIAGHLDSLDAGTRGRCHRTLALDFIDRVEHSLDLVFIDPPFGLGLAQPTLDALLRRGVLAAAAQLYLEMGRDEEAPEVPSAWTLWREKTMGEVTSRLYRLPEAPPGL